MRTKPHPTYEAGDRTGRLPEVLPLEYDAFVKAFTSAAPGIDPTPGGGYLIEFEGCGPRDVRGEHVHNAQLAYCITCHRAQGSEFPCVVVLCHRSHFYADRNWLYTAVTRASRYCILLGDRWGLRNAASGNPLDVQANGTRVFTVGTSSVSINPAAGTANFIVYGSSGTAIAQVNASTGGTTINSLAGYNPLTVQVNGSNGLTVTSDRDLILATNRFIYGRNAGAAINLDSDTGTINFWTNSSAKFTLYGDTLATFLYPTVTQRSDAVSTQRVELYYNSDGSSLVLFRARGTYASPASITTGQLVGSLRFRARTSRSTDADYGWVQCVADSSDSAAGTMTIGVHDGMNYNTAMSTAKTGAVTCTAPLIAAVGSAAAPSITFAGDTDTGLFRDASNQIGFAGGGLYAARLYSQSNWVGLYLGRSQVDLVTSVINVYGVAVNDGIMSLYGGYNYPARIVIAQNYLRLAVIAKAEPVLVLHGDVFERLAGHASSGVHADVEALDSHVLDQARTLLVGVAHVQARDALAVPGDDRDVVDTALVVGNELDSAGTRVVHAGVDRQVMDLVAEPLCRGLAGPDHGLRVPRVLEARAGIAQLEYSGRPALPLEHRSFFLSAAAIAVRPAEGGLDEVDAIGQIDDGALIGMIIQGLLNRGGVVGGAVALSQVRGLSHIDNPGVVWKPITTGRRPRQTDQTP